MSTVYLNGKHLPLAEAKISVLDRGFTFAEGIYEVIPVFSGMLFRIDEHLERLDRSLAAVNIENPHDVSEWKEILGELVRKNPSDKDQSVYLQVTRGVTERDHYYGEKVAPTVFCMCNEVVKQALTGGIKAVTHEDIRWKYCYIKSTALLANVLIKNTVKDKHGAKEAILIREGRVVEGTASNVFIVKQGRVKTPLKDQSMLAGITRDLVVELLQQTSYGCEEIIISDQELVDADEIWLSSSTLGVTPVIELDGQQIGSGVPGDVWREADAMYRAYIREQSAVVEEPA